METSISLFSSPIGDIEIHATDEGITKLRFTEEKVKEKNPLHPHLKAAKDALRHYFGANQSPPFIPLCPGGTTFQKRVWAAVQKIPYGKTSSYLDIARQLGDPNLTRAVGNANAQNPIMLLIPCHRVIGSNGALTGYAGGMSRKQKLLSFEQGGGIQQSLF